MKALKIVLFTAVMLVLIPMYSHAESLGVMRTSLIDGDVQIKIPDTGEWAPLAINTPLLEGDEIWVPDGARAELQLNTNTYVRLDQNTAFGIVRIERSSPQFYLSQGHAYVYYNAPARGVIQVDSPAASMRSYKSSIFRVDVPDEFTDVSVYRGSVYAENDLGRTMISVDMTLSLGRDTNGELAPMGPPDEWERWNKERNHLVFARRASYEYLPDELRPYAYDLDTGGRWVNVPEYGYVWTPTFGISVNWSPYSEGRWIWLNGDYVWVSYDSWGWAPFHYGRWANISGTGWCWVPPGRGQVYWSPGYVAWVTTGDYVGWVPLAPGEVYYGRGYYGPHSVNITNVNINQVRVTNVYRNANVGNAVRVVNKSTFLTGRPSPVNPNVVSTVRSNILARKITVGQPSIQPTAATRVPIVKSIPAAKQPPQTVRNVQIKQVQQSRPLVTDPKKSVFKPAAEPRSLEVKKVPTARSLPERMQQRQQLQPSAKGRPGVSPSAPATPRQQAPALIPEKRGARPGVSPTPPAPERGRQVISPTPAPRTPAAPQERRQIIPPTGPAEGKGRPSPSPTPALIPEKRGARPGVSPTPPASPESRREKAIQPPEGRQGGAPSGAERKREILPPAGPENKGRQNVTPTPSPRVPAGPEAKRERVQPEAKTAVKEKQAILPPAKARPEAKKRTTEEEKDSEKNIR